MLSKENRWLKRLNDLTLLIILGLLAISTTINTKSWITSWNFQQELINTLPIEELMQAKPGSFLLIDAKKPKGASEGLEAFWDTSYAVYTRWPQLRSILDPYKNTFAATMAHTTNKKTSWDGKYLVQAWCHSPNTPLWSLPAKSDLYLWDYTEKRLLRVTEPANIGCNYTSQNSIEQK